MKNVVVVLISWYKSRKFCSGWQPLLWTASEVLSTR